MVDKDNHIVLQNLRAVFKDFTPIRIFPRRFNTIITSTSKTMFGSFVSKVISLQRNKSENVNALI